jgi:hypothetical protein
MGKRAFLEQRVSGRMGFEVVTVAIASENAGWKANGRAADVDFRRP